MYDFERLLAAIPGRSVLCVGDVMLDDFVYGSVSRISPEAPAMVLDVTRRETCVGGAGNVVRNVASLGAVCSFVAVVGDDDAGKTILAALDSASGVKAAPVLDASRPTTRKARFVSESHSSHLLRTDWERAAPIDGEIEAVVLDVAVERLARAEAVILSDYGKGVLTDMVIQGVIDAAAGRPVVVDPKRHDFAIYRGAAFVTPNRKELGEAARMPVRTMDEVAAACRALAASTGSSILATLSEDGMLLHHAGADLHIPAYPVKVRDVSGAGDTVVAAFAVMLAAGAAPEEAARVASAAAAVAVGKPGTATVLPGEVRDILIPQAVRTVEVKTMDEECLLDRVAAWRAAGHRIGFANGCFDVLHPGHVRLLRVARAACDRLVVALNADASVRRLKGPSRPLQSQGARAEVMAALEAVDAVVVFEDDTPLRLIGRIRPDVLVKGADYRKDQVVGGDLVEAYGGQVLLVGIADGHSTTRIVEKVLTPA